MPKAKNKVAKSSSVKGLVKVGKLKFDKTLLAVIAVVVVAAGGYLFYQASHAATCNQITFRQGSSGTCVKSIQTILNGIRYRYNTSVYSQGVDYPALAVDGKYGSSTAFTVGAFQKWTTVTVDGVVGPKTWNNLCIMGAQSFFNSSQAVSVERQAYFAAISAGCKPN